MNTKRIKMAIASFLLTACTALVGTSTQIAALTVNAATQEGAINTAYASRTISGMQTPFNVKGAENYYWNDAEFGTLDTADVNTNDILKSNFEISDVGIAEGEKVFDMTFTLYRNSSNGAAYANQVWGVNFGMSEDEATVTSSDSAVWLNFNSANVGSSKNSHLCVYYTRTYTITVTGMAGAESGQGTLMASYTCAHCSEALTVSANVNFNGYFAFGAWGVAQAGKEFRVSSFSFNGNTAEENKTVSGLASTNFSVKNNAPTESYTWAPNDFQATNMAENVKYNAILKSNFKISDNGVADGEKVFEMSYNTQSSNSNSNTTNQWGVQLGLSEEDNAIDGSKAIGFNARNFYICGTAQGSHLCNFHNQWRTLKLTGYAGGKLDVSWECNYCREWQDFTVEGIDFNGYFAFGTWGTGEIGKTYRMNGFTFTGNTPYTLTDGLEMGGASIRVSTETSGLRFTAQTPTATVAELNALGTVEYGLIYQKTTTLGENTLTFDNYQSVGAGMSVFSKDTITKTIEGVEYTCFNFAFYNIPESDYTTEMTVRFYAKVEVNEGEYYIFYSDMMSRSIDYVARAAYDDPNTPEEYLDTIKTYIVDVEG